MATTGCMKRILSSTTIRTKRFRSFSTTTSNTISPSFTDPALEWGRQNPAIAQQCLQIPPTTDALATNDDHLDSLEAYWKWRQWDFSSAAPHDLPHAQAIVSHVLSAPLTLAQFYRQLVQQSNEAKPHRWCCVGARAEATLPLGFWKELLVSVAAAKHDTGTSPMNLTIDFVGPDIHPPKSIPPQRLTLGGEQQHQLELNWLYKGYLHDYCREKPDDSNWTAFVLLNPGLGHGHLKEGWRPTLEWLLKQADRPVLLTAHSPLDAQRDHRLLAQEHNRLVDGEPTIINPFASRILYEDPFDASHRVQPNHSVLVL